jgi:flagellar basal-body rod protein FlgF
MTEAVKAIREALHAGADALRQVAENMANLGTPAYKRGVHLSRAAQSSYESGAASGAAAAVAGIDVATGVDLSAGALRTSADPLHLAVDGDGFFVIDVGGAERLTRRGDFRTDASGRLVTQEGHPVLTDQGPLTVPAAGLVVERSGLLKAVDTGEVLGRLRLVTVPDPRRIVPVGDGSFSLPDPAVPAAVGQVSVRQGFLEASNVEAVGEMLRMMEVVRQFDMTQRLAVGYDQQQRSAITTLGRV